MRISSGTFHQEIETHVEDLHNTEFMSVFQELYISVDTCIKIQIQNLTKTWTYHGQLELLNVDEGEFSQMLNILLVKVFIYLSMSFLDNAPNYYLGSWLHYPKEKLTIS